MSWVSTIVQPITEQRENNCFAVANYDTADVRPIDQIPRTALRTIDNDYIGSINSER